MPEFRCFILTIYTFVDSNNRILTPTCIGVFGWWLYLHWLLEFGLGKGIGGVGRLGLKYHDTGSGQHRYHRGPLYHRSIVIHRHLREPLLNLSSDT